MGKKLWTFFNQDSGDEITIHDELSARNFEAILKGCRDGKNVTQFLSQWRVKVVIKTSPPQASGFAAPASSPNEPVQQAAGKAGPPPFSGVVPLQLVTIEPVSSVPLAAVATAPDSSEAPADPSDRRKHKRVDMRVRVYMMHGKNTFFAYTSNISLGGLKLERPLSEPFIVNGVDKETYRIVLGTDAPAFAGSEVKTAKMQFNCKLVDTKDSLRLRFVELDEITEKALMNWLLPPGEKPKGLASVTTLELIPPSPIKRSR